MTLGLLRAGLLIFLVFLIPRFLGAQVPSAIDLCTLFSDPSEHNGKVVSVQGRVSSSYHIDQLIQEQCAVSLGADEPVRPLGLLLANNSTLSTHPQYDLTTKQLYNALMGFLDDFYFSKSKFPKPYLVTATFTGVFRMSSTYREKTEIMLGEIVVVGSGGFGTGGNFSAQLEVLAVKDITITGLNPAN